MRKNVITPTLLMHNVDISTEPISEPTNIQYFDGLCYQFDFLNVTGTGKLYFEVRQQPYGNKNIEMRWCRMDSLFPPIAITSNTISEVIDFTQTQFSEIRFGIEDISSLEGTVTVTVAGKSIGH